MLHKTINQVTSDIERLKFNTAIAAMMTLLNYLEKNTCPQHVYESLLVMLSIFTPHITEELWMRSGKQNSIFMEDWPKYDKTLVISDTMTLAIQINGKVRHSITVPQTIKEDELQSTVLSTPEIKKWIKDDSVKRFIYIPAKIINIVI
jgi:leucyl-tRNA synthetase